MKSWSPKACYALLVPPFAAAGGAGTYVSGCGSLPGPQKRLLPGQSEYSSSSESAYSYTSQVEYLTPLQGLASPADAVRKVLSRQGPSLSGLPAQGTMPRSEGTAIPSAQAEAAASFADWVTRTSPDEGDSDAYERSSQMASHERRSSRRLYTCEQCQKGRYKTGSTSATVCTFCAAGKYGTFSGATSASACYVCPTGRAAGFPGQSACVDCGVGRYAATTGHSICTLCAAGRYVGSTGASNCLGCPLGKFAIPGASSCTDCA